MFSRAAKIESSNAKNGRRTQTKYQLSGSVCATENVKSASWERAPASNPTTNPRESARRLKAIHYRQIDCEPCPNQQNVNGAKDSHGTDHRLRPITTDSPRDEGLKL